MGLAGGCDLACVPRKRAVAALIAHRSGGLFDTALLPEYNKQIKLLPKIQVMVLEYTLHDGAFSPQGVPRQRCAVPCPHPATHCTRRGGAFSALGRWHHSHRPVANRVRPTHTLASRLHAPDACLCTPRVEGRHRARRMSSLWSECSRLTLSVRSARRFHQYSRRGRTVLSRSARMPTHHAA